MQRFLFFFLLLFSMLLLQGCLVMENSFTKIPPGMWRATLDLDGEQGKRMQEKDAVENRAFEEILSSELPFMMEVQYFSDDPNKFFIEIINGQERIRSEDITFGRNRSRAVDTIRISFPVFDSYIVGTFQERLIKGNWVVNYRDNYSIPFKAFYGENYRFTDLQKEPKANLTGKWQAVFGLDAEAPYPAVGEFQQEGNHLLGTFLTETGDFRYLEGTVQADKFYLSCFDGAHAFLFEGKIISEDSIIGTFRSGSHYKTTWSASMNPDAKLAHPDSLTFLKDGYDSMDFSFPDENGNLVSLQDSMFAGRPKIIQITGTWCPNCYDETRFLLEYLDAHPDSRLAVIGLAFERYKDAERARQSIGTYKEKMGIPYPVLHAGNSGKDEASKALPMLNQILSFPTMIFLDSQNRVRRIHTGFSGPATSAYTSFAQDFRDFVSHLE